MKHTLIFLFLLFFSLVNAQKQTFTGTPVKSRTAVLDDHFKAYDIFQLDVNGIDAFAKNGETDVDFNLLLGNKYDWNFSITPVDIRGEDYSLTTEQNGELVQLPIGENLTFQGAIQDHSSSTIALTLDEDFMYGFVRIGNEEWFIEPLWYFDRNAPRNQIVVYHENDVRWDKGHTCGATEKVNREQEIISKNQGTTSNRMLACYEVDLAIASDDAMFDSYGTIAAVEAHNIAVNNNVMTDYDNVFIHVIEFSIVTQFIVTNGTNPWGFTTGSPDAGNLLGAFRVWGNGGGFGVSYDLASLWTDLDLQGPTVGVAYLGVLCTNFRYNVLQDFSSNANSLRVLTSHEYGHNFDANHDPVTGFIMSPSVNNTNTWSTTTINVINGHITSRINNGCLTVCSSGPPPSAPSPAFTTSAQTGCAPQTILFTDQSTNNPTSWNWAFPGGSPSTSTAQNPTVTYLNPGTFDVSLSVSNANGTNSTTTPDLITIDGPPSPNFSFLVNNATLSVEFFNTTINGISYSWDFGDGGTSTQTDPIHTYPVNGTYDVTLTATNDCGSNSITIPVAFLGPPTASFSANFTEGCAPLTVNFFDTSVEQITSWDWSFPGGNPSTSNVQNPTVVYDTPGLYGVSLTVTNLIGTDMVTTNNYINATGNPGVSFNYTLTDLTLELNNTTIGASSYAWDFGDGNNSTQLSPTHTYAQGGTYVITLTAVNDCGIQSVQETITVVTLPTADYTANLTDGCAPFTVQYTDQSSPNVTNWDWSFPGGTPATSTEQNPVVVYNTAGQYDANLTVSNNSGTDADNRANFIMVDDVPMANFASSINESEVNFDNLSSNANSYLWNFGDGMTSTEENPIYTYAADGNYDVVLTANNDCGPNVFTANITIATLPSAVFNASSTIVCAGTTVQYNSQASTNTSQLSWEFPGGVPATSTDPNPLVIYNSVGNYNVSLTAINGTGQTNVQETNYIEVNDIPNTNFISNISDLMVNFTNNSTGANAFVWDFGDGNVSTDENPTHSYTEDGVYTVMLSSVNDCGTTNSTETITIITAPTANFTANMTEGCAPLTVQFNDQSSDNSVEWNWTFAGGMPATSSERNPTVVFDQMGDFTVTLVVSNAAGQNENTQTSLISVNDVPNINFQPNVTGADVSMNNSSSNFNTISWDFGNGVTSNDANPNYTYPEDGTYTINLSLTNDCGTVESSQELVIATLPSAGFSVTNQSGCAPIDVQFTNESSNNAVSYVWNFVGGIPAISSEENPTITYMTEGVYSVELIATNAQGDNTAVQTDIIVVNDVPTADFSNEINGSAVNFTNNSSNFNAVMWDFGDGNTSSETNPTYTYIEDGTYTATLTLTNDCGTAEIFQDIVIATPPTAAFSSIITEGCAPTTIQFTNESSNNAVDFIWTFEGGNPATSTDVNPTVTYENQGTFEVSLQAINPTGENTATETSYIIINDVPEANFEAVVTGRDVVFSNNSTNYNSITWDFGDGNTSNDATPQYSYTLDGEYTVTLTLENECGTTEITEVITIATPPTAGFSLNVMSGCVPFEVAFTNESSENAISFEWSFEGGTPNTSTMENPVINYETAGIFTVSLTVTNSVGENTITQSSVIIAEDVPAVDFSSEENGTSVNFTNNTLNGINYTWDFGDGSMNSSEENPSHTYAEDGIYTVTLTSNNNCGDAISTEIVVIATAAPIAAFTSNVQTSCAPVSIQFENLSSSNATMLLWTFEGGTPATSTEESPIVIYNDAGTFAVSLEATNALGNNIAEEQSFIEILPDAIPDFDFTANQTVVTFENQSQNGITYDWDFGDNTTSTEENPTHEYAQTGTYTVTLNVTNDCGTFTIAQDVEILFAIPNAVFSSNVTTGCAPFEVIFEDQSTGNPTEWSWTFAGGTPATSTEQNPTVTYASTGVYDVSLTVSNPAGENTGTQSTYITVEDAPSAEFTSNIVASTVDFTNTSQGGSTYEWDFGDGTFSSEENPSHTYEMDGEYTVILTVTNNCGSNSVTETILIVVNAVQEIPNIHEFKVFPNPNEGAFALYLAGAPIDNLDYQIFNVIGQELDRQSLDFKNGNLLQQFDYVDFAKGVYIIKLSVEDKQLHRKIVIE